MQGVMLYCRRGFEKECAGEIQQLAGELEVYGYCRVTDNSGYVIFHTPAPEDADRLAKKLPFTKLVFARQLFVITARLAELDADDRILYDAATGNLFYDADGVGGTAAILIATLAGQPSLTVSDLEIV